MDIVSLLVFVVVAALIWFLVITYLLPLLPEPARTIVLVIVVLIAIVWLLGFIGIGPGIRLR